MEELFSSYKEQLVSFIPPYLQEKIRQYQSVNSLVAQTIRRLETFVIQGKLLRGGLVFLSFEMNSKQGNHAELLQVASALEIIHSSLLIHDDIMDADLVRRGAPTIYAQYQHDGDEVSIKDPRHFGESMGICVGDFGFFLGFELLSSLSTEQARQVVLLFSQELSRVALAQMQDMWFGSTTRVPSTEEILNLYRFKTGRYTFSLPLIAGGILAHAPDHAIQKLEKLGECLGIIFQLKDDELGLFGNSKQLGKPVGSDIKIEKKTLFYVLLQKKISPEELQQFAALSITRVQQLIEHFGIVKEVGEIIDRFVREARQIIQSLPFDKKYLDILQQVVRYSVQRIS